MLPALSVVALLVFPLLMALAASSDLLTMRISNRLVLLVIVGFFVLALAIGMPLETIGMHLACAALVLVFSFAFFAFGWIGGGDAKLVAATTLWLGFGMMLPYLVYASLLGGALTLILLAARRWPLPERLRRVAWIDRLHDSKSGVPYGIALAAAGLLVYSDSIIFQHFVA
ncbi:prepilin peptidase [Devosia sp.]|uniref:A24 family peptidase n=1 Tax=Devosia sp. TaxID=1871048 RepID=UPI0035B130E9